MRHLRHRAPVTFVILRLGETQAAGAQTKGQPGPHSESMSQLGKEKNLSHSDNFTRYCLLKTNDHYVVKVKKKERKNPSCWKMFRITD